MIVVTSACAPVHTPSDSHPKLIFYNQIRLPPNLVTPLAAQLPIYTQAAKEVPEKEWKNLLRVTVQDANGKGLTLKIEGKLAGAQVAELRRAWNDIRASMGSRRLVVDLCGLTHVDGTGRTLLAEIHAGAGAEFVADTPLSKYFAIQATKGSDQHDPSE